MSEMKTNRGKKSRYVGKTLRALVDSNPRRPSAAGHASFNIILENPGISYEEFVASGGRLADLHWDVEKGRIEAV